MIQGLKEVTKVQYEVKQNNKTISQVKPCYMRKSSCLHMIRKERFDLTYQLHKKYQKDQ